MNRRAFFGFACGGVAAAPAAVFGADRSTHKPTPRDVRDLMLTIDVEVDGSLKAHVEEVARREVENHVWSHPWRDERPYRAART